MRHDQRIRMPALAACATTALLALASPALAGSFERVATWPVYENLPAGTDKATETAAEILSVSKDGRTLIYTDSPRGMLGFVDISLAASPRAKGTVDLGGEPTSVAVAGHFALAGVNTSDSFVKPSGHVAVVDLAKQVVRSTCDVGGQPDSVAVSPDGAYLAVVIENERDEDLNDGVIPQLPAGHLAILDLAPDGTPTNCTEARIVSLEGLAAYASNDPEPEYVSINSLNEAVVTLQENNHIAIVDLASGTVKKHYTAGTVSLDRIDATTDKVLAFDGSIEDVAREPDAVAWIDDNRFVTADEGDYTGGSRTFTIFDKENWVAWSSGASLEHLVARIGHYPEKRAGKKGAEPEGAAVGSYDGETLMFIGAERANAVAVYRDRGAGMVPELMQALPTGSGPEGILPIPGRRLLAVAAENDSAEDAVRSNISLYVYGDWTPSYPMIVSEADSAGNGAPIGWGALSGLAGNPSDPYILYAVPDSFYANSRIYTMDVGGQPARIVAQRPLNKEGAPVSYDLEGIAVAADGGFWLVSEGNPEKELTNLLVRCARLGARQAGRAGDRGRRQRLCGDRQ